MQHQVKAPLRTGWSCAANGPSNRNVASRRDVDAGSLPSAPSPQCHQRANDGEHILHLRRRQKLEDYADVKANGGARNPNKRGGIAVTCADGASEPSLSKSIQNKTGNDADQDDDNEVLAVQIARWRCTTQSIARAEGVKFEVNTRYCPIFLGFAAIFRLAWDLSEGRQPSIGVGQDCRVSA